jgi:lysophospholipase L1-like esterase
MKLSKKRLILFRMGSAVFIPLCFLILIEFALRLVTSGSLYLFDTNPHFIGKDGFVHLRPSTSQRWYGCEYNVNSNGFRMMEEVGSKQPKEYRVLAIGDSVTLGMGVYKTQDVWPNLLQPMLRANGFPTARVLNSGVQGWNLLRASTNGIVSSEFLPFLKSNIQELQPDLVIYCICFNDVPSRVEELFSITNEKNKKRFNVIPDSAREWFKRKATYRLARDVYRHIQFDQLDYSAIPTPNDSPELWKRVSAELQALKQVTEGAGAKMICVMLPFSYQMLPQNKELLGMNKKWQAALTECGIPWADITERMESGNVLEFYVFGDVVHPNEKGQALLAEAAMSLIKKL